MLRHGSLETLAADMTDAARVYPATPEQDCRDRAWLVARVELEAALPRLREVGLADVRLAACDEAFAIDGETMRKPVTIRATPVPLVAAEAAHAFIGAVVETVREHAAFGARLILRQGHLRAEVDGGPALTLDLADADSLDAAYQVERDDLVRLEDRIAGRLRRARLLIPNMSRVTAVVTFHEDAIRVQGHYLGRLPTARVPATAVAGDGQA